MNVIHTLIKIDGCSMKKGVLKNFAKFTVKRDSGTGVFSVNFAKF